MKKQRFLLTIGAVAISLMAMSQQSEYRIVNTFHLSGDGGWDYLSVDNVNSRLYVSHGTQVNVVDLKTGKEIAVIPGTNGVHGIAIANDLNKAFISCGRDTSVKVVNIKDYGQTQRIKVTGQNPDAIIYDPSTGKVLTFNGRSSNATVIDARLNEVTGTISLSGKPEFPQSNGKGKIFVNIEDKSQVSIIDVASMKVEKTWSIAPGEEPSGLAYDAANNRLFSVCSNKLMVISDPAAGKVITTVPIGEGCDGVAFDPARKRIFASCGEGVLTVVQQTGPDTYKVVENFPTKAGARTVTINRDTHHVYTSFGEREPNSRNAKPGTFAVLDIAPIK